jgi:hypothetical protein
MVIIINALGGAQAAKFCQKFADTLVPYLGGDETLIAEIRSIREAQEQLPDGHPLRLFGQTVEAEMAPKRDESDKVQRALKRQKQDCEQTVEAKHRILAILSAGIGSAAPPALIGMLNAARHIFASQALAQR